MNTPDEKTTYTRREFNTFFALLLTLFTAAAPPAVRAGIDQAAPLAGRKRRKLPRKMISPEEAAGCSLMIDFPAEEGWEVIHRLSHDDWKRVEIDPEEISPRLRKQLEAAKAAEYGTPVAARVFGDNVAVLKEARYFAPGEPDDRTCHYENGEDDTTIWDNWRIEWFGDGIRRVAPDNTSWMTHRLNLKEPGWSTREDAFHEHWLHENSDDRYGINYGTGCAQDLMLSIYKYEKPEGFEPWLTNRERKILATFVQWLGTNCGQGFLHEVKRKGGMPGL